METADYAKIKELLPHRYPFLMVDRVDDIVLWESARGVKNVTLNEPIFQGHFPEDPVFPGVLIVEALAQTAAVLAMMSLESASDKRDDENFAPNFPERDKAASPSLTLPQRKPTTNKQNLVYFMTIDNVKFRKPVRPGDSMELHVTKEQIRGNVWRFQGRAIVRENLMAEAKFMAMLDGSWRT
jgi:3-hydroxyacyl-[acyl-carrier-protein] dehydratase